MNTCAVSVVLIVRNTAPWLKACLDSIAAQSLSDFEVIVIDVDSNLSTRAVLALYSRQLPRVRVLRETQNIGGAAAGNIGIREARGDYVFLMDSDDVLPVDALRSLHDAASRRSLDVVIGRPLAIVGRSIKNMRYRADMVTWGKPVETGDVRQHPELTMAPFYWGRLYRREMLLEGDVFMHSGRLFADRYFTCKALKTSRQTGVILDNTYFWRRDRGRRRRSRSITQRAGNPAVLRDRVESFDEVEALFRDPAYAGLLRYVRLSNLMRLFIHTPRVADDPSLGASFAEHVVPYARSFAAEDVWGGEFLLARHKVQWFLITEERWDDLRIFHEIDTPRSIPHEHDAREIIPYDQAIAGLPSEACTQFRQKIGPTTARLRAPAHDRRSRRLEVTALLPKGMTVEPLHVNFRGSRPDSDILVPTSAPQRAGDTITVTVDLPAGIETRTLPALRLAYATHGRFATHDITVASAGDSLFDGTGPGEE